MPQGDPRNRPRQIKAPRQQVGELPEAGIQPVASPVNVYYRPNAARPDLRLITDFGQLSRSVSNVLAHKFGERIEEAKQDGLTFASENSALMESIAAKADAGATPEEQERILEREFRKFQRQGKIPEYAFPHFRIAALRAHARSLVGRYSEALNGRIHELARTVDPATGLPIDAPSSSAVLAQEWEKLQNNPVARNVFGQREMAAQKETVDRRFADELARRRGEQESRDLRVFHRNEQTQRFLALAFKTGDITPEDLNAESEWVTKELHDAFVENPADFAWDSLRLAASRLARDPKQGGQYAADFLDEVRHMKVGSQELGDHPSIGIKIEQAIREFEGRQEDLDQNTRRKEREEAGDARFNAETESLRRIYEADGEGLSPYQAVDELVAEYLETEPFGKFTPLAIEAARSQLVDFQETETQNPELIFEIENMIAEGEDPIATIGAIHRAGEITGRDKLQLLDKWRARTRVTTLVEENSVYQRARGEVSRILAPFKKYQGERGDMLQDEAASIEQRFVREAAAKAAQVVGQADAEEQMRTFYDELVTGLGRQTQERRADIDLRRNAAFELIDGRLNVYGDGDTEISLALRNGDITFEEATAKRKENAQRQALRTGLVDQATGRIMENFDRIAAQEEGPLAESDFQITGALRIVTERETFNRLHAWFEQNAGGLTEADVPRLFRVAEFEAKELVLGPLLPSALGAIKAAPEGRKVEAALQANVLLEAKFDVDDMIIDGTSPADILRQRPLAGVDQDIYDSLEELHAGEITEAEYQEHVVGALLTENLDQKGRAEAAVALMSQAPFSVEWLRRDRIFFNRLSKDQQQFALANAELRFELLKKTEKTIAQNEARLADDKSLTDAQRARLRTTIRRDKERNATERKNLSGESIDIGEVDLRRYAYTIRLAETELELSRITEADDFDTITKRLGIIGQAAQEEWITQQLRLINARESAATIRQQQEDAR